jgi:hypothetical protein
MRSGVRVLQRTRASDHWPDSAALDSEALDSEQLPRRDGAVAQRLAITRNGAWRPRAAAIARRDDSGLGGALSACHRRFRETSSQIHLMIANLFRCCRNKRITNGLRGLGIFCRLNAAPFGSQ